LLDKHVKDNVFLAVKFDSHIIPLTTLEEGSNILSGFSTFQTFQWSWTSQNSLFRWTSL